MKYVNLYVKQTIEHLPLSSGNKETWNISHIYVQLQRKNILCAPLLIWLPELLRDLLYVHECVRVCVHLYTSVYMCISMTSWVLGDAPGNKIRQQQNE